MVVHLKDLYKNCIRNSISNSNLWWLTLHGIRHIIFQFSFEAVMPSDGKYEIKILMKNLKHIDSIRTRNCANLKVSDTFCKEIRRWYIEKCRFQLLRIARTDKTKFGIISDRMESGN